MRKDYPDYENDSRSMNGAFEPAKGDAKLHFERGGEMDNTGDVPSRGRKKP